MNWLGELLKQVQLSKALSTAIFISSTTILLGNNLFPNYFDPIPTEWRWLVVGICVFSGVLLFIWAIQFLIKVLSKLSTFLSQNLKINKPTFQEREMIIFLANDYTNDCLNLNNLNYKEVSKLEVLQTCKSLERKGLVSFNSYDSDLVSLTDKGSSYAYKILK